MSAPARLAWADWMKGTGIFLIVYGHLAGSTINGLVEPVKMKQIGVAFFVFVLGFLLVRERRPVAQVVFNRLFEILLVGIAMAAGVSAVMLAIKGDANESNYLPFFLGANVLVNNFPANPTTWFIGTYIHLVLLWALLLRRVRLTPLLLLAALGAEVLLRAGLIVWTSEMEVLPSGAVGELQRNFIAYMALPNWLGALLLGMYAGQCEQQAGEPEAGGAPSGGLGREWGFLLIAALLGLWALLRRDWPVEAGFPFQRLAVAGEWGQALATSAVISMLYLGYTVVAFGLTRRLGASRIVGFLARNSLFVFIVHMPLLYACKEPLWKLPLPLGLRIVLGMLLLFVLPALVSEGLFRLVPLKGLRDGVWARLSAGRQLPQPLAEAQVTRAE